jgi:ADP-heptose:LPS heptosyltransferase
VLAREMARPAAGMIPGIDSVLCLNTPWLSRHDSDGWAALIALCMKYRGHFDIGFELHGDARNIALTRVLSRFCVGTGIRGFGFLLDRNVAWKRTFTWHVVDLQLALARGIRTDIAQAPLRLKIAHDHIEYVDALLGNRGIAAGEFVLVQMSAGLTSKEWPMDHWEELVSRLLEQRAVVTADLDRAKVARLSNAFRHRRFVSLQLDIPQYAACLSRARAVVTVDTFPVHLAAALRKPMLALYSGINLIEEWGPYAKDAPAQLLQDTDCPLYPCSLKRCPLGSPSPCMKRLSVRQAVARISVLD